MMNLNTCHGKRRLRRIPPSGGKEKKEITDKEKIRSPYEKVDGRDYSLVEGNMRNSIRCSDK